MCDARFCMHATGLPNARKLMFSKTTNGCLQNTKRRGPSSQRKSWRECADLAGANAEELGKMGQFSKACILRVMAFYGRFG